MTAVLVAIATSQPFARRLADHLHLPLTDVERQTFPDGESYLRFDVDEPLGLLGKDVVLIGATDCAASLDELYRLGCTACKCGARSLVLVIPYFGYSTMERAARPGEVVAAKTIARQLSGIPQASNGNRVLLMDLHSPGIVHYFEGAAVPLELTARPKMIAAIEQLGLQRLCLASVDMGGAKWVEGLANQLHAPVALIHKKRLSGEQTRIAAVVGDVAGRNVVIYDDMIRTGGSLVQAAEAYQQAGAASVHALVTHLVMPEGTVAKLEAAPLVSILGTDTHPRHQTVADRPRFQIISVADLFADVVGRLIE